MEGKAERSSLLPLKNKIDCFHLHKQVSFILLMVLALQTHSTMVLGS